MDIDDSTHELLINFGDYTFGQKKIQEKKSCIQL